MTETSRCNPAGSNPARPRRTTSRNRVLRGPRATAAAKRRQGACRPCDGAPRVTKSREPTPWNPRKATPLRTRVGLRARWSGAAVPPGSESRACTGGLPRNLGALVASVRRIAAVPPSEGNEARWDGRRGVGAPQYERRNGGTDPRDPVEQRAAPGHGTVGGKDDGDIELHHCLNATRTDSEAGERGA